MFLDESGFMLQPVCRRTWAPRGQTPLLRQWDRRDRLSTISALTVAPRRRRFGLYWAQYPHNIRSPEVLRFLQALHRHLPHGLTLIWDRGRPHRATRVQTWLARHQRIVVEWLPSYAPDLNPVEHVWGHTKYGDRRTSLRPTSPPWNTPCSPPWSERGGSGTSSLRSSGPLDWNCDVCHYLGKGQ